MFLGGQVSLPWKACLIFGAGSLSYGVYPRPWKGSSSSPGFFLPRSWQERMPSQDNHKFLQTVFKDKGQDKASCRLACFCRELSLSKEPVGFRKEAFNCQPLHDIKISGHVTCRWRWAKGTLVKGRSSQGVHPRQVTGSHVPMSAR